MTVTSIEARARRAQEEAAAIRSEAQRIRGEVVRVRVATGSYEAAHSAIWEAIRLRAIAITLQLRALDAEAERRLGRRELPDNVVALRSARSSAFSSLAFALAAAWDWLTPFDVHRGLLDLDLLGATFAVYFSGQTIRTLSRRRRRRSRRPAPAPTPSPG